MKLNHFLREPLHRNSALIILSQASVTVIGFAFWWLAARLISEEEVGLAVVLVSTATLLATLSLLGYDIGIVRHFPVSRNKCTLINTYLTVAGLVSLLAAIIYVSGIKLWSPELLVIYSRWYSILAFVGFTCLTTVGLLQQESFVAMRKPGIQLIQNTLSAVKFPLVWFLASAGAFGIFYAWGVTSAIMFVTGTFLLIKALPGYRPVPGMDLKTVRTSLRFNFANYVAKNLDSLPANLMPLLVLSILGSIESAHFYYPLRISTLMGAVIWSVSAALLAEGSHNPEGLRMFAVKAIRFSAIFLFPLALIIVIAAPLILHLFGNSYAGDSSVLLLRLLTLSWLPGSINVIYVTVSRIKMRNKPVVLVYGVVASLIIGGSIIAMQYQGLAGIGWVWLVAQSCVALFTMPLLLRKSFSSSAESMDGASGCV